MPAVTSSKAVSWSHTTVWKRSETGNVLEGQPGPGSSACLQRGWGGAEGPKGSHCQAGPPRTLGLGHSSGEEGRLRACLT